MSISLGWPQWLAMHLNRFTLVPSYRSKGAARWDNRHAPNTWTWKVPEPFERLLVKSMIQNPVSASRGTRVWIPIAAGLFMLALALSAAFVPRGSGGQPELRDYVVSE